jgi:hypothetical protein
MARSQLEPRLGRQARKTLAKRLRAVLSDKPLSMREIAAALDVEPEVVVVGMRELRARRRGHLRTSIRFGHVCWFWQADANAGGATALRSSFGEAAELKSPTAPAADDTVAVGAAAVASDVEVGPAAPSPDGGKPAKRKKKRKDARREARESAARVPNLPAAGG